MKLYVTHDREGNILGVAMKAPDAEGDVQVLAASPEQIVSEVQVTDKPADFADEEKAMRRMTEVAEQFRVDVAPQRGKLVRRQRKLERRKRKK